MNFREAWQSVLVYLQMEMPRASFDTWARDTEAMSFENGVITVSTRNAYARDWLASRLTEMIQGRLRELLNESIVVRFIVGDAPDLEEDAETQDEAAELVVEPVGWLDYDKIVQPHKQVVVKGYLRRLGMEIGPKAVWLYIGFHQAAWLAQGAKRETHTALHSKTVQRFSALSHGTFWRLLKDKTTQQNLAGLVQRVDDQGARKFRRGRDGRPHRAPIRYQVFMTPRLTRADSTAIHSHLKLLLSEGKSLEAALRELLAVENMMELLATEETPQADHSPHTVMEMARLASEESISPRVNQLAQELHRRIINSLGDIHVTHYFITQTIRRYNLTPAQAWLVTVARDMAYLNARTGERREVVTFKGGYREMAALTGSKRYKTVQAWLNPRWTSQQRGGDLTRFLIEQEAAEANIYLDLRADSMSRTYRVLLDEPLDADGSLRLDANGRIMAGADGSHSQTQVEAIADANGSNMADANGSVLNSFKHPANTDKENTATTQHARRANPAEAAPRFWELETLLQQNDVHPKVQRELLEAQASVHAFVSWVLYVTSPQGGRLSDPLGYALSRLREHPLREARGVFRQFADLPPAELLALIDATPSKPYQMPIQVEHPLASAWEKAMGFQNSSLPLARAVLFGAGGDE